MEQVPDPLHSFKVAPTYSEKPKFNPDQPSFTLGWRNGGMEGRSVSDFESLCGCGVKLFALKVAWKNYRLAKCVRYFYSKK